MCSPWPARGRSISVAALREVNAGRECVFSAVEATSGRAEAQLLPGSVLFPALVPTDIERHLLPNRLIYPAIPVVLLMALWFPADGYISAMVSAVLGVPSCGAPNLAVPGALGLVT